MWHMKNNKPNGNTLIDTENKLRDAKGEGGVRTDKTGEGD